MWNQVKGHQMQMYHIADYSSNLVGTRKLVLRRIVHKNKQTKKSPKQTNKNQTPPKTPNQKQIQET